MPAIKFRGVDFIDFDSLLNDDERLVRDTARRFIEENLVPIIEECNRAGRFPRELVKPMADLGFFGASLHGYGCAAMSNVEYGLVTQELERGDSGVRSFVSVQSALVMYPIYTFGSDEQKNTWLPALQKGEKIGCFGLPEPGALWHRVGSGRRGNGVLRLRAAVFHHAQTMARSAYRLASTRAGETRLDDHRDHQGAVTRAPSRPLERRGKSAAPAHLDGEEKQRREGAGMPPPVARHSRRERHRRRLPHHAALDESGKREDL